MQADNTHSSNITSGSSGTEDKLASAWFSRIEEANKRYVKWAQKNKCDKMEQYYQGDQWEPTGANYEPYVINLFFSTIQVQLPTLLFDKPVFHVKPKPSKGSYNFEHAASKAQLREDLLNTVVSDEDDMDFAGTIELAILDSFSRFGVVEVGYNANWIINPNAGKPVLRSDNRPYTDGKGNVIHQPDELPTEECIYIKRIHAKNFRVGGLEGARLQDCNWCGYWEFVRIEDLKANPTLKNKDRLHWSGTRSNDFVPEEYGPEIDSLTRSGDLIKIWHIWDLRAKKRHIFADPQHITLYSENFDRLNLFDLRPNRLTDGWYPLPPLRNWKPAQDEINDSHEQMRNHRKRFVRKFVYNGAAFPDEEEVSKLINGGDGTFVKRQGNDQDPIKPVPNADLGSSEAQSFVITKDDFNIVSGTSSEQRGQADKTTATQANIINQKSQIRDSRSRIQIAKWLCRIGNEILRLAEEKFTAPIWVKMLVDQNDLEGDAQVEYIYHQITAEDLGDGMDFNVEISLDSMSPIANDDEKNKFLLFLGALAQYPELSESPDLVFELAYKIGYRNRKVIKQLQQVAKIKLQIQLAQLGIGGQQENPMAQQAVAAGTPNNMEQIRQQLVAGGMMQ